MAGPEAKIERSVCDQALRKLGIPNVKWGVDGWPDRIFLLPGCPFFIEFKAPGEEPKPRQAFRIQCLKTWGYKVEVCYDVDTALMFLQGALNEATRNLQNKNTKSRKIYVGSSVNVSRRLTHHRCLLNKGRHWNKHLQASWNKYGSDSFQFEALEFCEVEDLLKMEQKWIDSLEAFGSKGYNMVPVAGSVRGRTFRHTEESKMKMSLAKKGKSQTKSPEHKEAHRIAMEKLEAV